MQQAAGIIAEYNPFHNGHLYHLRQTKSITGLPVIVVMSGSIMQRGEPAFLDKWTRSRLAVANGADLVIELPCAFSLRSAQYFATGAAALLEACGCVSVLSCGAENPELDFPSLARLLTSDGYGALLQQYLKEGLSYAAASEQALHRLTGAALQLDAPNDILALEYCKALRHSSIKPLLLRRLHADYNDTRITGAIASATAVRHAFSEGRLTEIAAAVPENVYQAICSAPINQHSRQKTLWSLISYRLRMLTPTQIAGSCQCSEGLENALKAAASCSCLDEAVRRCSGRRYPAARIRRLLLQLLLHRSADCFDQQQPAYLRILAFNDNGRSLLQTMKKTCSLPLLTKLGQYPCRDRSQIFRQQLELELAASDLLALLDNRPSGSDYRSSPYYQK